MNSRSPTYGPMVGLGCLRNTKYRISHHVHGFRDLQRLMGVLRRYTDGRICDVALSQSSLWLR
jgi:hypothetical protein